MQKTGKFPIGADVKCEQNGLYVEQAFIMFYQKKDSEAKEILLKRMNSENIQQCIILAIRFGYVNDFFEALITRANRNT